MGRGIQYQRSFQKQDYSPWRGGRLSQGRDLIFCKWSWATVLRISVFGLFHFLVGPQAQQLWYLQSPSLTTPPQKINEAGAELIFLNLRVWTCSQAWCTGREENTSLPQLQRGPEEQMKHSSWVGFPSCSLLEVKGEVSKKKTSYISSCFYSLGVWGGRTAIIPRKKIGRVNFNMKNFEQQAIN